MGCFPKRREGRQVVAIARYTASRPADRLEVYDGTLRCSTRDRPPPAVDTPDSAENSPPGTNIAFYPLRLTFPNRLLLHRTPLEPVQPTPPRLLHPPSRI